MCEKPPHRRGALLQIVGGVIVASGAVQAHAAPDLQRTPLVTLGPFYPLERPRESDFDMTRLAGRAQRAKGEVIEVTGRVLNVRGEPVRGGVLDLWQTNAAGRYAHPSDPNTAAALDPDFQGFARIRLDSTGAYRVVTVKPGAYPVGADWKRPPHLHIDVSGRYDRISSQMWFPGEALNGQDRVLADYPKEVHAALFGKKADVRADGVARFTWDIVLQRG